MGSTKCLMRLFDYEYEGVESRDMSKFGASTLILQREKKMIFINEYFEIIWNRYTYLAYYH